jgi:hypothetical protein
MKMIMEERTIIINKIKPFEIPFEIIDTKKYGQQKEYRWWIKSQEIIQGGLALEKTHKLTCWDEDIALHLTEKTKLVVRVFNEMQNNENVEFYAVNVDKTREMMKMPSKNGFSRGILNCNEFRSFVEECWDMACCLNIKRAYNNDTTQSHDLISEMDITLTMQAFDKILGVGSVMVDPQTLRQDQANE